MLVSGKQVAIIGAGPGGLTLARLLQLKGVDVTLYERDASPGFRQQGATLDLHENAGLKALAAAGLTDAFKASYRPDAGRLRVTDKTMHVYLDDHLSGEGYTEIRPEIDRGPLRDLLVESLRPGTICWDHHFLSMEKNGREGGWTIYFKNGTSVKADIVIAADGANSKIRPYLTGIQPVYSGITVIEGTIKQAQDKAPGLWKLTKGGKVFMLDQEKSVATSAKGDGSLTFYFGLKVAEDWVTTCGIDFQDKERISTWLSREFRNWSPVLQELLTSELPLLPRVMCHFPPDQHWHSQCDLTLIGDAAHRMPPYAGEGANMAMLDALQLAEALTSGDFPDLYTAIAAYENDMLKRAAVATEATLDNTRRLHSPDAIEQIQLIMQGS